MSENKTSKTNIEVIVPPNPLKDQVKVTGEGSIDPAPIQRAEQALKQLSVAFDDWLGEEVAALTKARDLVRVQGLTEDTQNQLHRAAHDLKGQAETYGYPLISKVCSTLCKLLESSTQRDLIPFEIIDHHVNAVRNMMKLKMKTNDNPKGVAVSNKLYEVVVEFAEREDKKRQQLSLQKDEAPA